MRCGNSMSSATGMSSGTIREKKGAQRQRVYDAPTGPGYFLVIP